MGIFNRGLLFVYTLFFGLLCVGVVCICVQLIPERVLLNEYEYLVHQWQTPVTAGAIAGISLHLFLCSLSGSRNRQINAKELLLVQGQEGQVAVSMAAIRDSAVRLASEIRGVRKAKVSTKVERRKEEGDFLKLDISLEVGQERPVADISDEVRRQLGGYLANTVGVADAELSVSVQSIIGGVAVKKRHVN